MDKLTPIDGDLIAMVTNITGQMPILYDRIDKLELVVLCSGLATDSKNAIIGAIKGRLGERLISIEEFDGQRIVCYFKISQYADFPLEYRAMFVTPEEIPGTKYINRNLYVHAFKVDRKTLENLLKFTGGGTMVVPRSIDGVAEYSFLDNFGTMVIAKEGQFIVKYESRKYKLMSEYEFKENFYI